MSDELSPDDIALINGTPKAKAHFEEWGDGFWALRCAKLLRDAGDVPITARLFNCLISYCDTLDEVASHPSSWWLSQANFGRKCCDELESLLHQTGRHFVTDEVGKIRPTARQKPATTVSVRLLKDVLAEVDRWATDNDVTRSDAICCLIARGLAK